MSLNVILRSALSRALTWAEHDQNMSTLASGVDAAIGLSQTSQVASTAAQAAATAALTAASQASTSASLATSAWAASTAPAEKLATFNGNLHFGAVVKSILYDTAKDSDGGAWRKRCADKSWYTEALGGDRWLGLVGNIAVAWSSAGSTTGAVFQASATGGPLVAGKYYTATSATTATEVFRGISREFPAQVAIVAETARVVIYDLTQASCPMWMVFTAGNAYMARGSVLSVSAINGMMALGCGSAQSLALISFPSDSGYIVWITTQYTGPYFGGISQRNAALGFNTYGNKYAPIVNQNVNDVAITVLDTAPIDPATGLPVPTIAVACGSAGVGGVSIIRDDGTVVNAITSNGAMDACSFGRGAELWVSGGTGVSFKNWFFSNSLTGTLTSTFDEVTIPARRGTNGSSGRVTKNVKWGSDVAFAINSGNSTVEGISRLKQNTTSFPLSLLANITNAYNSGWLPGDIRGAYLADTVAETITASGELVTNGTFTTDTSGWTAVNATFVQSGGAAVLTSTAVAGRAYQAITLVVGRTYYLQYDTVSGTNPLPRVYVGSSIGGLEMGRVDPTTTGTYKTTFVATATTGYLSLETNSVTAGQTYTFDNISVKLADPDRSVKNNGMVLNGSLTKTAVASGAGLVAYSGFSASNYLEQPYSANLDFGTGDFCVMGWVLGQVTLSTASLLSKCASSVTGFQFIKDTTTNGAKLYFRANANAYAATGGGLGDANWHFCLVRRLSGLLDIWQDGIQVLSSVASADNISGTYVTQLGWSTTSALVSAVPGMALWRISATAPSADQIAHIYRTELPLFQANAQCTIAGTSTAVTALAYDDVADTLHVGTAWGRSGFRDLLRVDSEATTTGAITSLSANEGVVITGGASSAKAYAPAMYLRDELRRKDVARKALGRIPAFFDYTATASQTAFVAPKGFTIKALYKNGTLMRETTTGVYWTRSNDGFQETATLSVGAAASDWISIMCVKA